MENGIFCTNYMSRRHADIWSHPGHYLVDPYLGHQIVKITFDLENSNITVMAMVKPFEHIWGLEFIRYVSFSFRGNCTIFGRDIVNSIFDLEN